MKLRIRHPYRVYILILGLILGSLQPAMAHKVRVFAYTSGDTVVAEAYIGSNQPLRQARVVVTDTPENELILEGQTDDSGQFRFSRPQLTPNQGLTITVHAGQGHQGQWTLLPEDLGQEGDSEAAGADKAQPSQSAAVGTLEAPLTVEDRQQLAELVARAVAREVEPLKVMLAKEMNRGPSMQEIIGGIGWLVGIGGLLAALKMKKE